MRLPICLLQGLMCQVKEDRQTLWELGAKQVGVLFWLGDRSDRLRNGCGHKRAGHLFLQGTRVPLSAWH